MTQELAKRFAAKARCRSFSLQDAIEEAGEKTLTDRVLHAYIEHSSILARGYDRFNYLASHGVIIDAKQYIWLRKEKNHGGRIVVCSAKTLFDMVIACDDGAIFIAAFPAFHEDLFAYLGEKKDVEAERLFWDGMCRERGGIMWPKMIEPGCRTPTPELSYFS